MKIGISGAGIAGLTAALYLKKEGHDISVFEKANQFKDQGYGLSIKTFGVDILNELGLLDSLPMKGLAVSAFNLRRSGGTLIRRIPAEVIGKMTGGAIPVSRASLHRVLYEAAAGACPISFDTTIARIEHLPGGEKVTFKDGSEQHFDLLIIAEGLRSTSRQMMCGDMGWAPFDIAYMAADVTASHDLELGQAYAYRGIGRNISIFPVDSRRLVIQAYFHNTFRPHLSRDEMRLLLQETFGDFAPEVRKVVNGLQPGDSIYYDTVAMVQLPVLCSNNVVFIGDAAHSTTFLSGMGASLGMLDGKLLAKCLLELNDVRSALIRFNAQMLPICKQFQQNARKAMKREIPTSRFRLYLAEAILKLVPFSVMVKNVHSKLTIEKKALAKSLVENL